MNLWTQITEWLLHIPPFTTVNENERGVWLRGGKYKRTALPGFYWKWPVYDVIETIDIMPQVVSLDDQSITTKDGESILISGMITYEISNAKQAWLNVQDVDVSIQNYSMGILYDISRTMTFNECRRDLSTDCFEEISDMVEKWGVELISVELTDCSKHRVIRLLSHDKIAKEVE